MIQGMDGALQVGSIADVKIIAFGLQQPTGRLGLLMALFAQIHIRPAGKEVQLVPFAFAMADQNEFHHGYHSFPFYVREAAEAPCFPDSLSDSPGIVNEKTNLLRAENGPYLICIFLDARGRHGVRCR